MRHVWILRHAKAARDGPDGDDHSRPLTGRGRRQSAEVADYLKARRAAGEPVPDLVLSSSAARALATAEVAHGALGPDVALEVDGGLYRAGPDDVMARLRVIPADTRAPMVVGHNPTLHELVIDLVADEEGRSRLDDGFPTAALALVALDVDAWTELSPALGRLVELYVPPR